jgi:hypothetical protein
MIRTLLASLMLAGSCYAQTFSPVPFTFTYGTQANASQVQANFQSIVNNGNAVANAIQAQIAGVTPPPSGVEMSFNLSACPSGWLQSGYGTGVFSRGYDAGRGLDTTGTGIAAGELPTLQDHTHTTSPTITATSTIGAQFYSGTGSVSRGYITQGTVSNPTTGSVIGANIGSTVIPKTVYLINCLKL